MHALIDVILLVLWLYRWVIIVAAILSWLVAFGVVNRYNHVVAMLGDTLFRLSEPALRPIRRVIPDLGGVDISPIIALVIIYFLEILIRDDLAPLLLGPYAAY